jgi:hypothetical protein
MSILSSKPLSTPKRNGSMAALKRSVTESLMTPNRGEGKSSKSKPATTN